MNAVEVQTTDIEDAAPNQGDVRPIARDDFERDVWCVKGVPLDAMNIAEAADAVLFAAAHRQRLSFVTPNVNILVACARDPQIRRMVVDADLSLVDGAPLVALARAAGAPFSNRCAGSDLFDALRARPGFAGRRLKVFFFGGRDGAAEAAFDKLSKERGGVEAVGFLNPGFGDVDSMSDEATIEAINRSGADFVVVSLGFAKGQAWIDRNVDRLEAPVVAHLGAVVDFAAGGVKRAPKLVAALGAEWLWRIAQEPALWRRYARDCAGLAALVLKRDGASKPCGDGACAVERMAGGVRLSGDLSGGDLALVRKSFRDAAAIASGAPTILDMSGVTRVGPAFLGLVLLLEKHVSRAGGEIVLQGAAKKVRAAFAANNMQYRCAAKEAQKAAADPTFAAA